MTTSTSFLNASVDTRIYLFRHGGLEHDLDRIRLVEGKNRHATEGTMPS
jgi:hypothetical protein